MRSLIKSRDGVSTVEFALFVVLFMGVFVIVVDFGWYFIQKRALTQAVASATVSAFANRTAVSFDAVPGTVQSASGLDSASVAVTCNGAASCTNTSRSCACLSAAGTYTAATCGSACGSGLTAGYYMTIKARYTYKTLIMRGKYLDNSTMASSATVRLQ